MCQQATTQAPMTAGARARARGDGDGDNSRPRKYKQYANIIQTRARASKPCNLLRDVITRLGFNARVDRNGFFSLSLFFSRRNATSRERPRRRHRRRRRAATDDHFLRSFHSRARLPTRGR